MSAPADPVTDVLTCYDAGYITVGEAAHKLRELLEPPTVAAFLERVPARLSERVVPSGSGQHVGEWFYLGGSPSAEVQWQSRVAARVGSEWYAGHWRTWPHTRTPLRTSELEDLAASLQDPAPAVRAAAAAALAWRGEWDDALLPLLADDDPLVRGWAGWATALGGGPTAPLLALLEREPPELRPELAWVLVDRGQGSPRIAEALVPALATEARWMAARVLAALGPQALPARDALVDGLTDPHFRGVAMHALAALGDAVVPVLDALDGLAIEADDAREYCGLLEAGGAVSRLIDALERPELRTAAAERLANFPSPAVAEALLRAGREEAVIRALGAMGVHGASAVPALTTMVATGGRDGEEAARALGALGEVAAEAAQILAGQVWAHVGLRGGKGIAYAIALERLGTAAEGPCLFALRDARTRSAALRILGRLDTLSAASTPAIAEWLDDPDGLVRMYATLALAKAPDAAEPLVRACRDPHREVRVSAAKALAWRPYARALPALLALVEDGDTVVRWCAVSALGALGDPRARVAITKVLVADDKAVLMRRHATIAARAAWALGVIGHDASRPVLGAALGHSEPDVRLEAATALGRMGGRGVRAGLLPLRGDEEPAVRERAEALLERLRAGERWPPPDRDEVAPWASRTQMSGPMRYNSDE